MTADLKPYPTMKDSGARMAAFPYCEVLRQSKEIRADILAPKKETEGLLDEIIGGASQ